MDEDGQVGSWWRWVQANLTRLGWSESDMIRRFNRNRVSLWRRGTGPMIPSMRIVAQMFTEGDPSHPVTLLDVLVAAGDISEDEANARTPALRGVSPKELAAVPDAMLLQEIARRMASGVSAPSVAVARYRIHARDDAVSPGGS